MNEKNLLTIALVCSLIGILTLFYISNTVELEEKSISELDAVEAGQNVRVKGVISQAKDLDKIMLIDVVQPQTINVMIFKDGNISLNKGDFVELIGELREYKGKKEIIANKIEVLE